MQEQDLIVISPWYAGLTFQRYYTGKADWIMLPNLTKNRMIDGYPEVHDKFLSLNTHETLKPELARIRETLTVGGKSGGWGCVATCPRNNRRLC